MNISRRLDEIISEIQTVFKGVSDEQFSAACSAIIDAKRIFITGLGRSGLIARMFGMRLMQAGLSVHIVGDCTTPSIQENDLLIALSGSGNTSGITNITQIAQKKRAKIFGISYNRESELFCLADTALLLPAPIDQNRPGKVGGSQVLGTLFDQSLQLCTTLIVEEIMQRLGVDDTTMQANHANLE